MDYLQWVVEGSHDLSDDVRFTVLAGKARLGSPAPHPTKRHEQGRNVRRILNLAASEWMDDQGLTWILTPPKIKLPA